MARVSGERDPSFTSEELERLVDGVLPQYTLLYGPPDKQVSAHQKKGIWHAIAKEVRTLGAFDWQSTHCRKRWEDLCRWARKMAEAQLGLASQRGRGAHRTLTPLMFHILAVAYPELDGRLKASQQPQGASSGRRAEAQATKGAASHMGLEAESTEGEGTSGMEGERSTTTETGGDTTDSDSSSDGSSLAVADTSVPTPTTAVRGSKEAPLSPASVPPTPAKAKKVPPPGKGKKGTASSKEKEAQPASKAKSKTPAARSKEEPPSAKGRKRHRTPARALQPSEAIGEGLEATTTTASTATCTAASTATCTATCTAASSTTASSSSPSGQTYKATGERLEPPPTTAQPSPSADGL
ncbi:hypothetical protein NDU88_009659 [Pleurodeles waltl]|uniref:Myb/SANT-like DNA-binding domain-containing protein n=1 Tax=Pleurodeles waltl TaxID=8319 RepID=A0AAV7S106_PLEWA|nr:hypothetical protein NDU88_009659 [Pleurodeles waltl]